MQKLSMLFVPLSRNDLDQRFCSRTGRLGTFLGLVQGSYVGDNETWTVRKHFEAQHAILDCLTRCHHIQSRLADAVW